MKKGIIIVVVIIGLGLIIGFFVVGSSSDNDQSGSIANQSQTPASQPSSDTGGSEGQSATGQYIEYSDENVAMYPDVNKVVFFHADWCPNCRALERNVLAGSIPEDIIILKADFDRDTDLKQKYGVTAQTTLVQINDAGDKVKLWIGSAFDDIDSIQEEII